MYSVLTFWTLQFCAQHPRRVRYYPRFQKEGRAQFQVCDILHHVSAHTRRGYVFDMAGVSAVRDVRCPSGKPLISTKLLLILRFAFLFTAMLFFSSPVFHSFFFRQALFVCFTKCIFFCCIKPSFALVNRLSPMLRPREHITPTLFCLYIRVSSDTAGLSPMSPDCRRRRPLFR